MSHRSSSLPRYDTEKSYDWNYEHAPQPIECDVPPFEGDWSFCGIPVNSPLGIAAGPLLNGKWLLYYASLGFDVLTYKTVRSSFRESYSLPNLLPVEIENLNSGGAILHSNSVMCGSWAISFGMPSKDPRVWRDDVEQTKRRMTRGKVLCVSVVGTVQLGWTIDDLAKDYADCAQWAVDAGADAIELNFSCPNVDTCDGQLYQDVAAARLVAETVRSRIGPVPMVLKIGHIADQSKVDEFIETVAQHVNGLAMTNCIAARVIDSHGDLYFGGQLRGIGGQAIRAASIAQIERSHRYLKDSGRTTPELIGVGGASSGKSIVDYLAAGASAVHIATAAMLDPEIAIMIRSEIGGIMDTSRRD